MSKPRLGSSYQRKKKLATGESVTLPIWWIKYYGKGGERFYESSGSEKYKDAENLLKRRLGEIATGKFAGLGPERIRFRELAEEVVSDYELNEKSSLGHVKRRLQLHLLPALGDVRAVDFGTPVGIN